MISRIDHYNIATQDLERSIAFYTGVLGLELGARPPFGTVGAWLYGDGHPLVHLSTQRRIDVVPTGRLDHIAFRCRNVTDMALRLQDNGIDYRVMQVPPISGFDDYGTLQLFLSDPDGIAIELNFPDPTELLDEARLRASRPPPVDTATASTGEAP
jgi:catechol 2,3-dioxygenase-like lactoylglutathione lyase family enzyme